jgi:hypothetical protein
MPDGIAAGPLFVIGSVLLRAMRLEPKRTGSDSRIKACVCPPCGFVARAMDLTVMVAAQRHSELIADFAPESAVLHETQMMRIRWLTAANETGLFGPVTNAARLRIGQMGLVDACEPRDRSFCLFRVVARHDRRRVSVGPVYCALHKSQPSLKGIFNQPRICRIQRVFCWKNTANPK